MERHDSVGRRRFFEGPRRMGAAATACLSLLLGCDAVGAHTEIPVGQFPVVVAIGDSYAAGLGATGDGNPCRRSDNGFIGVLAEKLQAKEYDDFACEGWNPADVLHGKDGMPSQIDLLPANASLVVVSIGGNAVNLRDFGKACLSAEGCGPGSPAFENAMKIYLSTEYHQQLKEVCARILSKAPDAIVLLAGYPKPIAPHELLAKVRVTAFGEANDKGVAAMVDMMNAIAQQVVAELDDPRLFYGTPAANIDVVSTKIADGNVDFHLNKDPDSTTTGHPNNRGYQAMAAALLPQLGIISREMQIKEKAAK